MVWVVGNLKHLRREASDEEAEAVLPAMAEVDFNSLNFELLSVTRQP